MQWINFRFVPLQWRVLFIDLVHFFWDIYLVRLVLLDLLVHWPVRFQTLVVVLG
eukprot:SAG31_NODE_17541_length_667_cov_0.899648_1_plen_54_part_00